MTGPRLLELARRCIAEGRYELNPHFVPRMGQRGLFWGDVLELLDGPTAAVADGLDDYGRHRLLVTGPTTVGESTVLLCLDDEPEAELITIYWGR